MKLVLGGLTGCGYPLDATGVDSVGRVGAVQTAGRPGRVDQVFSSALEQQNFVPFHGGGGGSSSTSATVCFAAGGEAIRRHRRFTARTGVRVPVSIPSDGVADPGGDQPQPPQRIGKARAKVLQHVSAQLPRAARLAVSRLGSSVEVRDRCDATLVAAHSEKEQARGDFKGGQLLHPSVAWCYNSGENARRAPASRQQQRQPCPGPHQVLTDAIGPVPAPYQRRLLVRADTADATHDGSWNGSTSKAKCGAGPWITPLDPPCTKASQSTTPSTPSPSRRRRPHRSTRTAKNPATAPVSWRITQDSEAWRSRRRGNFGKSSVRQKPHPGAGLTPCSKLLNGWRDQALATNTTAGQLSYSSRLGHRPTPGSRTRSGSPRTPASARLPVSGSSRS